MKIKTLFKTLAATGILVAASSCDEADTTSSMPLFSGFEFEKPVLAGDTLVIVAKQSRPGKRIYTTNYKWACLCDWSNDEDGTSGRDTCAVLNKKVNYGVDSSDPVFKFYVPDNAYVLTVSFDAEYNYAGQGPSRFDGSNVGGESAANGYIRPVSSNPLFGLTRGSVRIRIKR